MNLNIGLIANLLPFSPQFICGQSDHTLCLSDVRELIPESDIFSEDILYCAEWPVFKKLTGEQPAFAVCIGGAKNAADYFSQRNVTGIILEEIRPEIAFAIMQSIFLRFSQLECRLLKALMAKEPTRNILNICSDFFQNHIMLFDSESNLVDYSTNYLPDNDDPGWKETLGIKKRSEKLRYTSRKINPRNEPNVLTGPQTFEIAANPFRDMTRLFYSNGRYIASLEVLDNNKPVTEHYRKLLDYVSEVIEQYISTTCATTTYSVENLRSAFVTILNKVNIDPTVVTRCLNPWKMTDDYRLLLIIIPENARNVETLTKYLYIFENIFPECIACKFMENIVLIIHNDTEEILSEGLPKLKKYLTALDGICGVSLPFNSIFQINIQYINTNMAIQLGDKSKRIHHLKDVITNHLINKIANDMPLIPLCHRGAVRVFDYDQQNGTNLLLTLEVYLRQNKSQKAAAEELHIHRSTLTYRLNCIGQLGKIKYDDSKERLHILLSCIALRNLRSQHLGV